MLTEVEMKKLSFIFSFCCKSVAIPFAWDGQRMFVNVNSNVIKGNYISWFLLIPVLVYEAFQVPSLIHNCDMNGIILHGMVVLTHTASLFYKLAIWLFKEQMVQLINDILYWNTGNQFFLGYRNVVNV